MLHYLSSHHSVRTLYPVTNGHFKIINIDEMVSKIKEVSKLFLSFEQEKLAFRDPIAKGDIA